MTIASLIVNVSGNTVDFQKNVEKIHGSLDNLTGVAGKVGLALAGAFTVTAIVGAANKVLDFASSLTDLSAKTGISTTGLQKLGLAFEQSGVSMDAVAQNAVKLEKALISGDKGVVSTLNKLGLSLADLKQMAPEKQFLTVADAIGKIQNPTEKAYAAMTVFGKGGAELLAGLDGHLQETTQHFEDMGLVIDEKTVAAADEFGDKMGLVSKQLMALVASVLTPLLPLLSAAVDGLLKMGQAISNVLGPAISFLMRMTLSASVQIERFFIALLEGAQRIPLLGKHLGIVSGAVDWLREDARKGEEQLAKMSIATTAAGHAASVATAPILGLGGANETAARGADKHASAIRSLVDKLSGADLVASVSDQIEAIQKIGGIGALTHEELDQFTKDVAKATEKMLLMGQVVPASWLAIANTVKSNPILANTQNMLGDSLKGGLNNQQLLLQSTGLDAARLMSAIPAAIANQNISATVGPAYVKQMGAVFTQVAQAIPNLLQQAFTGGGGVVGAFKAAGTMLGSNMASGLLGVWDDSKGMISKGLLSGLKGWFGKFVSSAIPVVGALLGPLLGKIGGWFQGVFGTDEEARLVNPARDQFLSQFGGAGTGAGSGFMNLAAQLTSITGEEGGGSLFRALTQADTTAEFNAAVAAIKDRIASVHSTNEQGFEDTTTAADGLNLTLNGSDDAIRALGETQDRVVQAMLAGFDKLIDKLNEFVGSLGAATGAATNLASVPFADRTTSPAASGPDLGSPSDDPYRIGLYHSGGMVWPRAHRGMNLAPDEVPIIAQTGERVLNREETRAYNRGRGGDVHLHVGTVITSNAKTFVRDLRLNNGKVRSQVRLALGIA